MTVRELIDLVSGQSQENKGSLTIELTKQLGLSYVPYSAKVSIVAIILNQIVKETDDIVSYDSAILNRIKTQTFIEACTTLDMNEIDEETGLDGYDLLCAYGCLNLVLIIIEDEYNRFNEILNLKLEDLKRDVMDMRSYTNKRSNTLMKRVDIWVSKFTDSIKNFNVKDTLDNLSEKLEILNKEK